ncbi:hypothetical protein ACQY0O_007014 [Thecaphora frezii]
MCAPSSLPSSPPPPRVRGSYYERSASPSEALLTWHRIQAVLARGDLDALSRTERCEREYAAWAAPVRAQWGGLEAYIRHVRLGWKETACASGSDLPDAPQVREQAEHAECAETWPQVEIEHPDGSGRRLRHFIDDSRLELHADGGRVCVVLNDWPYAVPDGVQHWVVWSKLPILHAELFADPSCPFAPSEAKAIYTCILHDGVRGFTGLEAGEAPGVYGNLEDGSTSLGLRCSTESPLGSGRPRGGAQGVTLQQSREGQRWAAKEITGFVRRRWPEEAWETAFFCNPPHLRTVPGLSHFQ